MQTTNSLTINSLMCAFAAVAMGAGTSSALAATLTAVPMQGGMVMPMVAYRAEGREFQTIYDPEHRVDQWNPSLAH
jgi:hypothetical protein